MPDFKRIRSTHMEIIKLKENYTFAIEPQVKSLRLVVSRSGVENVYRLETRKKLEKFLLSDENHLFKGRLQLVKNAAAVNVLVKGKPVGKIVNAEFIKILRNIESAISPKQIVLFNHSLYYHEN